MTDADRELFLAAKAAGYAVESYTDDGAWVYEAGSPENEDNEHPIFLWRPRADDGDALRLAVKLRFDLDIQNILDRDWANNPHHAGIPQDEGNATRRAIVRAAAEIGKAL